MKSFRLKYSAVLFLILWSVGTAKAQQLRVNASLECDSIWLGDQIKLLLMAEVPDGSTIHFPAVKDSLGNGVEVVSRSPIDSSKLDGGRLQLRQTFVITCFDSGPRRIEPFGFARTGSGAADTLHSNSLTLFVRYPGVDLKKGPTDIKKPFSAPVTFKEIAPWLLGIILIGSIIFLIIYAVSRYRKNKPLFQAPPKPKTPPHVVALSELEKLKAEELWQHEKVKEYYTRLTDILRVYIEERFDVPAMEQTSMEILDSFKSQRLLSDSQSFDKLKRTLELADLVKFAKYFPLPDDNHLSFTQACQFVENTKVEVVDAPAKADEAKSADEIKTEEKREEPK